LRWDIPGILNTSADREPSARCPVDFMPLPSRSISAGRPVFLDKDSLVPTMEPRVFVGTKEESDGNNLYFQDFLSYQRGIRFESPNADDEATFETGAGRYMFEYERALDVLMACALRRRNFPKKD
jgi:hypothetical protein